MGVKKILSCILVGIILSGCAQSTAMLGPAITLASTGNVSQAGLTFFTNKAVEKETGMDTVTYVSNKLEQNEISIIFRPDCFKNACHTVRYPNFISMGNVNDRRLCASG